MNKPYSQFFWRDHESDLQLANCHMFAQGVWARMLAIMAQGEPFGHLRLHPVAVRPPARPPARPGGVPGGIPSAPASTGPSGLVSGDLHARYTLPESGSLEHIIYARLGITKEEAAWSIEHLERHGVFSRTPEGVIYCRRMVRDEQKHAERVRRAVQAYERRARKEKREQPSSGTSAPPNARPSGTPRGTPPARPLARPGARPPARASGVPGGPPITTTSNPRHPPHPPSLREGGLSPELAQAAELLKRKRGTA